MSSRLCCQKCFDGGLYKTIFEDDIGSSETKLCIHHVHEYSWDGSCGMGMISDEICSLCKKRETCGPLVEIDREDTLEGHEIYICSHKCLIEWMNNCKS